MERESGQEESFDQGWFLGELLPDFRQPEAAFYRRSHSPEGSSNIADRTSAEASPRTPIPSSDAIHERSHTPLGWDTAYCEAGPSVLRGEVNIATDASVNGSAWDETATTPATPEGTSPASTGMTPPESSTKELSPGKGKGLTAIGSSSGQAHRAATATSGIIPPGSGQVTEEEASLGRELVELIQQNRRRRAGTHSIISESAVRTMPTTDRSRSAKDYAELLVQNWFPLKQHSRYQQAKDSFHPDALIRAITSDQDFEYDNILAARYPELFDLSKVPLKHFARPISQHIETALLSNDDLLDQSACKTLVKALKEFRRFNRDAIHRVGHRAIIDLTERLALLLDARSRQDQQSKIYNLTFKSQSDLADRSKRSG